VANQTQSRPHPELANGVAWMPVSLQSEPEKPSMPWAQIALAVSCLFAGILIAQAHQNYELTKAQQRADRALNALQAMQQAKSAYCQGVAK
jgi:hypothetical protein